MMLDVQDRPARRPLCVDFDGVIHSYMSPWAGAAVISDPPVEGAIEFLMTALDRFEVSIFSVRNRDPEGIKAMRLWLMANGMDLISADRIQFPTHKPQAHIYLDDRGWQFNGVFPSLDEIEAFKPWNRR